MRLNIGPLTIELSGVTEQEIPVNSRLFLDHKPATKEADRYYTFYFVNRLPLPSNDWQITFQRNDIVVFRKEEQETRLLAVGNLNACYALHQERNERDANIYFIEGLKRELQTDTLFISCLCLERPLSVQGCYILHCTFLDYRGQAILFSGPSGIGKSTHANLWCRHIPGTQVLNGDRALLCPLPSSLLAGYNQLVESKAHRQSTRRSAGFDQTDKHQHLCVQHESGSSLHPAQVSDQTGNYPIM